MKLKEALENWHFIDEKDYFITIHQKDNYTWKPLLILDKGKKIKEFLNLFMKLSDKTFSYYYGSEEDGYSEVLLTEDSLMNAIVHNATQELKEIYHHLYNWQVDIHESIEDLTEELSEKNIL